MVYIEAKEMSVVSTGKWFRLCTAIGAELIQVQNDQEKVIGSFALTQIRGGTALQGKNGCRI